MLFDEAAGCRCRTAARSICVSFSSVRISRSRFASSISSSHQRAHDGGLLRLRPLLRNSPANVRSRRSGSSRRAVAAPRRAAVAAASAAIAPAPPPFSPRPPATLARRGPRSAARGAAAARRTSQRAGLPPPPDAAARPFVHLRFDHDAFDAAEKAALLRDHVIASAGTRSTPNASAAIVNASSRFLPSNR